MDRHLVFISVLVIFSVSSEQHNYAKYDYLDYFDELETPVEYIIENLLNQIPQENYEEMFNSPFLDKIVTDYLDTEGIGVEPNGEEFIPAPVNQFIIDKVFNVNLLSNDLVSTDLASAVKKQHGPDVLKKILKDINRPEKQYSSESNKKLVFKLSEWSSKIRDNKKNEAQSSRLSSEDESDSKLAAKLARLFKNNQLKMQKPQNKTTSTEKRLTRKALGDEKEVDNLTIKHTALTIPKQEKVLILKQVEDHLEEELIRATGHVNHFVNYLSTVISPASGQVNLVKVYEQGFEIYHGTVDSTFSDFLENILLFNRKGHIIIKICNEREEGLINLISNLFSRPIIRKPKPTIYEICWKMQWKVPQASNEASGSKFENMFSTHANDLQDVSNYKHENLFAVGKGSPVRNIPTNNFPTGVEDVLYKKIKQKTKGMDVGYKPFSVLQEEIQNKKPEEQNDLDATGIPNQNSQEEVHQLDMKNPSAEEQQYSIDMKPSLVSQLRDQNYNLTEKKKIGFANKPLAEHPKEIFNWIHSAPLRTEQLKNNQEKIAKAKDSDEQNNEADNKIAASILQRRLNEIRKMSGLEILAHHQKSSPPLIKQQEKRNSSEEQNSFREGKVEDATKLYSELKDMVRVPSTTALDNSEDNDLLPLEDTHDRNSDTSKMFTHSVAPDDKKSSQLDQKAYVTDKSYQKAITTETQVRRRPRGRRD